MEATAVSLARAVLDGVLSIAGSAIADEVARIIGVPKEVEFIRNELEMMQASLKVASAHPEATVRNDDIARTWVKQVRDLAYDLEDCLAGFALYADRTSSSRSRARSWLPAAVAERSRIAARVRDLKASVEALNQRYLRYHVAAISPVAAGGAPESSALHEHDDERSAANAAFQASDIIGRGEETKAVTKLLSRRDDDGGGGALRVVSVWGMGGMGKSSLVRMVYNDDPDLLDKFDCCAWVTVPHPLDNPDVFARRLRKELGVPHGQEIEAHLRGRRYLVVVDDLVSKDEWKIIWQAFRFDNNKDSRIIVTTRREDIARHCAGTGAADVAEGMELVYELKPLEKEESKRLLCQKVRSPYRNSRLVDEDPA